MDATEKARISAEFVSVAQEAAKYWADQGREKLREKFRGVYEDYAHEMETVVDAIARLPHRNGTSFLVEKPSVRGRDFSIKIKYTVPASLGPFTNSLSFNVWEGKGDISAGYEHQYDKKSNYDRSEQLADFEDARRKLALWFASVAPDRIPELAEMLIKQAPSVTTKSDMQARAPIRLKTPAGSTP